MAIQVDVPKDLSGIKQKIVFNLTGRQVFSFGLAGMVGIPFYLFTKDILGTDISALGMVAVMLLFFMRLSCGTEHAGKKWRTNGRISLFYQQFKGGY